MQYFLQSFAFAFLEISYRNSIDINRIWQKSGEYFEYDISKDLVITYIIVIEQTVDLESVQSDGALEWQKTGAFPNILIAPDTNTHLIDAGGLVFDLLEAVTYGTGQAILTGPQH